MQYAWLGVATQPSDNEQLPHKIQRFRTFLIEQVMIFDRVERKLKLEYKTADGLVRLIQ